MTGTNPQQRQFGEFNSQMSQLMYHAWMNTRAQRFDLPVNFVGGGLPRAADGMSECWTNAWEYAVREGGRYVEGYCTRPGRKLEPHAFVVTDEAIIETTPGYEEATDYQGVMLNHGVVAYARKKMQSDIENHCSVVELLHFPDPIIRGWLDQLDR